MWQVVAYKVDCGTDQYDFGVFLKERIDDVLHQIAMEHDNSYGYEDGEVEQLMDEEQAREIAYANKQERVSSEVHVLQETEDENEANEILEHFRCNHCPSEFIPHPY